MRIVALPGLSFCLMLLFINCDTGTNGTGAVISDQYAGAVYDAVMAAQLPPSFEYDSTRFTYIIRSDNTYEVDVLIAAPAGNQKVETGTWSAAATELTFSPEANFASNATTHLMEPADTLRTVHTGTLVGDSLTIGNFINIGKKTSVRELGTIVFHKQ